ncbi:MAG: hypothetical protein ACKPDI_12430 [Actinomycetota bacterium]
MTAVRITITVEEDLAAELRDRVPSGEVSAFVVEAIRQRLRVDPVRALLDDLDQRYGSLTDAERKEGAAWFDELSAHWSSTPEQ